MKRSELEKIFIEEKKRAYGIDENNTEKTAYMERLKEFYDENGKIDLYNMISFIQLEAIKYTNNLVYGMLDRILEIEEDI